MNDPRLDRDTAERLLRGEPAGPERLARLLAAASSDLTAEDLATEDLAAEEAALTAFRAARSARPEQPRRRRVPALAGLKLAAVGLMLLLAGGVAMATTAQHLPGPLHEPSRSTRTPGNPARTHLSPRGSAHPTPSRPSPRPTHPSPSRSAHPQRTKTHPAKGPNANASKNSAHKPSPGLGRASSAKAGHKPGTPDNG